MTTNAETLEQIIGVAYRERVINHSAPDTAYAMFSEQAAADPEFMAYARTELSRFDGVSAGQCFTSSKAAEFLRDAIDRVENG